LRNGARHHSRGPIDVAAERLRNTRQVCRQSYVHPGVLDAFRDGSLAHAWGHCRNGQRLSRPERTLVRILDEQMA
jgi:DNA topoisomerase IB